MSDEEGPTENVLQLIQQIEDGSASVNLSPSIREIIDCLDTINRRAKSWHEALEDAGHIAYAVAAITGSCLDVAMQLQKKSGDSASVRQLVSAAWQINCAWEGLLAGDEEDLHSLVEVEAMARGFPL